MTYGKISEPSSLSTGILKEEMEEEVRNRRSSCDSEANEYRTRRCEKTKIASLLAIVTLAIAVRKRGIARDWCVFAEMRKEGWLLWEIWARCNAERARKPWRRKGCCIAR